MDTVLEFPLIRRDDVAEAFRPAGVSSVQSAMRTLRDNGWLGGGIELPLRTGSGGKLAGRPVLYSALSRDVAVLARQGRKPEARHMASLASGLEDKYRAALIETLSDLRFVELRFPRFLFLALPHSAEFARALGSMAAEAQSLRDQAGSAYTLGGLQRGHVAKLTRDLVEVQALKGKRFPVARALVGALDLDFLTAPVVVRSEMLSSKMLGVEVEPGLDVRDKTAQVPAKLPTETWSPYTSAPKEITEDHRAFIQALADQEPLPRPRKRAA